jgi:hypothetical protein
MTLMSTPISSRQVLVLVSASSRPGFAEEEEKSSLTQFSFLFSLDQGVIFRVNGFHPLSISVQHIKPKTNKNSTEFQRFRHFCQHTLAPRQSLCASGCHVTEWDWHSFEHLLHCVLHAAI